MTAPGLYDAASLNVRAPLGDAHRAALEHFAKPGTWWSAKERLEIFRKMRADLTTPVELTDVERGARLERLKAVEYTM